MFWDKGYTPSQNIEALLEKENVTVEEFLDDEDILQECKTQKKGIVNYFTRPDVIKRLVEFIITEPSEELPMTQRFRRANMACEILTLNPGLPSLDEKLLSDAHILKTLYSYLENEPPLHPLLSSFFSKTFSMLFTKKPEQDWFLYQQMCLQLLEFIKSQKNFLDLICKHFSTPVIPDLILQMMRDVEGGQLKRNLYEWLTEDKLVERLIAILANPQETDKHTNVAEFICDLIHQGRSMRQTEQENDSFEPAFDGSNPILKAIESEATIKALLNVILEPNAEESAIVAGISVVLTLIKPVLLDEPNADRLKLIQNREKEIHEAILTTVIRVIAPRLKDFNELLRNPPNKSEIVTTAATLSPPFGATRLQICRVFTVLLQTKNQEVSEAIAETNFFETLIELFKQYCWNNFLHTEVEKCLQLIFYPQLSNNNNSTQGSTIVNDGSFGKNSNNDENSSPFFDFVFKSGVNTDGGGEPSNMDVTTEKADNDSTKMASQKSESNDSVAAEISENLENNSEPVVHIDKKLKAEASEQEEVKPSDEAMHEGENENDTTKVPTDSGPSALQTHVIVQCKLISKLINCWQHNKDMESAEKGRRLGYMGHLIKIFKHITNCISESEHIGALIENNLSDASESELWQSIVNPNDGDFTKAIAMQSKMLANCNVNESSEYCQNIPKDFLADNSSWTYIMSSNILSNLSALNEVYLEHDMYRDDLHDNDDNADNDLNLYQFGRSLTNDDDEEEDENPTVGDEHSFFRKNQSTTGIQNFGVTSNPWDSLDPFSDITANSNTTPWAADFSADNFADFDAHFSSFTNDLGKSLSETTQEGNNKTQQQQSTSNKEFENPTKSKSTEEYDNNANVEKSTSPLSSGEDDDNVKNETAASSLLRNLRSVIQDSEDDYEDDEGMWTKPLGSSAEATTQIEDEEATEKEREEMCVETIITNGPSLQTEIETKKNEELNASIDIITSEAQLNSEADITEELNIEDLDNATISEVNVIDASNKLTSSTADANLDKKLLSNAITDSAEITNS